MATKVVNLKFDLTTQGIDKARKELERLNASMSKVKESSKAVSNSSNKLKRNLEGTAQRSGNVTKDFARQAQGMGGLVAAYATIAANVFALSSGFLVLRRAADLSSMIKSAEDFSNRFGVSVVMITKRMQEAAGGALDFAEALPTINKAVSAGIGIEQMEKLTVAATKAAQTFGGSATEALSRFISASQRGRVEIIQTLGVVIKTEQAYADYAASIGKIKEELTAFDRQQAILNATIAESERVFAGITIDPNPFQQFLTTLVDLKNTILTTVTDGITPFINVINKSIPAALIIMGIILKSVASRAFPLINDALAKFTKAGIESSRAVTETMIRAKEKRLKVLNEEAIQIRGLTLKQNSGKLKLLLGANQEQLSQNKAFNAKIFNQDGTVNKARLIQLKAFLGKAASLRAKGTILKGTEGLSDIAITNARNLATAVGAQSEVFKSAATAQANYNATMLVSTNRIKEFGRTSLEVFGRVKLAIASTSSALKSGFAGVFANAQKGLTGFKIAILDTSRAWKIFIRDIVVGGTLASKVMLNLGKVAGRTVALLVGGLAAIAGPLFTFFLYLGLAKIAWDALQDKFNTGAKRLKDLKETFSSFNDSLKDITDRTNNYIANMDRSAKSTSNFVSQLEFLRGTLDSTLTSFNDFDLSFSKSFGGKSLTQTIDKIVVLKDTLSTIEDTSLGNFANIASLDKFTISGKGKGDITSLIIDNDAVSTALKDVRGEVGLTEEAIKALAKTAGGPLIENFTSLNNLFKEQGIDKFQQEAVAAIRDVEGLGEATNFLISTLSSGDSVGFTKILESLDNGEHTAGVINALTGSIKLFGKELLSTINAQITAGKALSDLDNRISNFVSGIDKLKAASVPNKETVNFIIDAKNALDTLAASAKVAGNIGTINAQVVDGDDLEILKQFFDIQVGDEVEGALKKVNAQLDIYRRIIDDGINAANRLKVVNLELKTLKDTEIRSDEARLSLIRKTTELELERAVINRNIVLNNIKSSEQDLTNLRNTQQGHSDRAKQLEANLVVLEATRKAREAEIGVIQDSTKFAQETIKIEKEKLAILGEIYSIEISIAKIQQSQTSDFASNNKIRSDIFKKQLDSLKIKKAEVKQDIKLIEAKELQGPAEERLIAQQEAKLALLDAQTYQLIQQNELRLKAGDLQATGNDLTPEGMTVLGHIMTTEIHKGVRDLAPTLVTLGKGFANAVNGTVDSAVDKLLEGHGFNDFAYAVQEALKDGLRQAFGDALKNAIKQNIAGLFPALSAIESPEAKAARLQSEESSKQAVASQERLKENTTSVDLVKEQVMEQIIATKDNTVALESCTKALAEGCAGNSVNTSTPNLNVVGAPVMASTDKAKALVEEGNAVLDNIASESTELNRGIKLVADAVADTGNTTVAAFISVGGQLLSALATKEGGGAFGVIGSAIGSLFGASAMGTGGVMNHSNIRSLADGAVTKGPELAVIGEGKNDEAVVPLPNNRAIPVDLQGIGGDTINIEQHFDFRNADTNAIPQLRAEARAIEDRTFNRVFSEINKGGKYAKMVGRR